MRNFKINNYLLNWLKHFQNVKMALHEFHLQFEKIGKKQQKKTKTTG